MNQTYINDFESLRMRGGIYIDKTHHIYKLIKNGKYYLLNRPDKFGKSLLISTIKAYFEGKSDLFRGLAIENLETEWVKYPVLLFDWGHKKYSSVEDLQDTLNSQLSTPEYKYGIVSQSTSFGLRLLRLIDAIYAKTKSRVVILVDNYDKPLMDSLFSSELKDGLNRILQSFYEAIKVKDSLIEFCFMTGISKIGDSNVFGGFNSLYDISMNHHYTDICGISEIELHRYFDDNVHELGKAYGLSKEQCYERIADMYGLYHFCENSLGIYNPGSIISCLPKKQFSKNNVCPLGATTTMSKALFDKLVQDNGVSVDCSALRDSRNLEAYPISLLYRTGILTIKEYDREYDVFHLGFPNNEVIHQLPFRD